MDEVINKTKALIDSFEESTLILNLSYYKEQVLNNKELVKLINEYNDNTDDYEKVSLKNKIYKYSEYKEYMKYYNELFYYVLKINNLYKKYTSTKGCNI